MSEQHPMQRFYQDMKAAGFPIDEEYPVEGGQLPAVWCRVRQFDDILRHTNMAPTHDCPELEDVVRATAVPVRWVGHYGHVVVLPKVSLAPQHYRGAD